MVSPEVMELRKSCVFADIQDPSRITHGRRADGKRTRLSRLILIQKTGADPEDMDASHLCHQRACINPDHLVWETRSQNLLRRADCETDQSGEGNTQARLTWDDVAAIRRSDETQKVLATRYGVSQQQISNIRANRSWTVSS